MANDPILTPLFISAGVTGSIEIGAATISYASIASASTLLAASVAVGYLTMPGGTSAQDGHQALKQSIPPRNWAYGRNRIAGAYMLYEAKEDFSYDVLAIVSGRVKGFVDFYLNDDKVKFTGFGGSDPTVETLTVAAGEDGRYGDGLVRIAARLGLNNETYYSECAALTLPADALNPSTGDAGGTIWDDTHRGDGIASMMLICEQGDDGDFLKHYPNSLPKASAVLDGYPIWDPCNEDDPDDDTLWQARDNPVLVIIDYLTHGHHGLGYARDRLITPVIDALMAEADKCDALIAKKGGGTEKRYRCNTWGSFDMDPAEALADMLASCDGWISLNGDGTLALKVGVYEADPDEAIAPEHIVGFSVDFGAADEELINEFVLGFTSPDHDYTTVPGQPWRDEASISLLGKVRSKPFSPKSVQSHGQLRRLAKRNMARVNAPIRGQMTTTLFGLTKAGKRWINLRYPFFAELEDCVVEVRRMSTDFVNGTCTFDWVLIDPATIDAWDAEVEEGDPPIKPAKLNDNDRPQALLDNNLSQPITDNAGALIFET